ncbi:hypothetical protein BH10ACI4_BH10ACI4_28490 [soil metagenome]
MRYIFGPFELHSHVPLLLREGQTVAVPSKVLASLVILISRRHTAVSKREMMDLLWPDAFVEEGSLAQNISQLRKLLAPDFPDLSPIETIPKIGYRFRGEVLEIPEPELAASPTESEPLPGADLFLLSDSLLLTHTDNQAQTAVVPTSSSNRREVVGDAEVTRPSRSLLPQSSTSRWMIALTLSCLLLVLGVLAYRRSEKATASATGPRSTIAVLPFVNLSNSSDKAWISSALRETLATDLRLNAKLRIVPAEEVDRATRELGLNNNSTPNHDQLKKLSEDLDCKAVVTGTYLVVGGRIRLNTRLLDVQTGASLSETSLEDTEEHLLPLIASAGSAVRSTFGPHDAPSDGSALEAGAPIAPAAYQLYIEGLDKTREYDGKAATSLLLQAINLEPDFPLAHLALSDAYTMLGERAKASAEATKALALSKKLPREQQLNIQAQAERANHKFEQAAATYKLLYSFYPDNFDYGREYIAALDYAGHGDLALKEIRTLLARPEPGAHDPRIYSVAADIYSALGDWPAALDWAERGEKESQRRNSGILYERMLTTASQALLYMHQLDPAKIKTEEALRLSRQYRDLSGELRALNRLGQIEIELGNLSASNAALESALALERSHGETQRQIHTLLALGQNYQRSGDAKRGLATLEEALSLATAFGQPEFITEAALRVAEAHSNMGDLKQAAAQLLQVRQDAIAIGDRELESQVLQAMARTDLKLRQLPAGLTAIQEAIRLARVHSSRSTLCSTLNVEAEILFESRSPQAASAALSEVQGLLPSSCDARQRQTFQALKTRWLPNA